MMKEEKFYIPIILSKVEYGKTRKKVTMLNANKIKELALILPTKQLIKTHLEGEMDKVLEAKKTEVEYTPKPLLISISKERLLPILSEIYKKTGVQTSTIPLVFQSGGIPCCVIGYKGDPTEIEDGYLVQKGDKIQIVKNSGMMIGELCVQEVGEEECQCSLFEGDTETISFPARYNRKDFRPILKGKDGWLNEDYVYKIIK